MNMSHKTGAGRKTSSKPIFPKVEDQDCPAGGTHVLTNDSRARTTCEGCSASWAALDGALR